MSEERLKKIKQDIEVMDTYGGYKDRYLELYNEVIRLREENERLKEQCKEWKENHKAVCIQRDNILDNIVKNEEERIDYKQRIEKAVEILKNWDQEYNGLMKTNNIYIPEDKPSLFDLRDILNGRSDE